MSGDLKDKATTVEVLNFKSVENRWQVLGLELNVYDSTDDRLDVTDSSGSLRSIRSRYRTRTNVLEGATNAFRTVLTRLLLGSANWSDIGVVRNGRKGRP